jgi:hypothetical protein
MKTKTGKKREGSKAKTTGTKSKATPAQLAALKKARAAKAAKGTKARKITGTKKRKSTGNLKGHEMYYMGKGYSRGKYYIIKDINDKTERVNTTDSRLFDKYEDGELTQAQLKVIFEALE